MRVLQRLGGKSDKVSSKWQLGVATMLATVANSVASKLGFEYTVDPNTMKWVVQIACTIILGQAGVEFAQRK